jgi:hypothetical protein
MIYGLMILNSYLILRFYVTLIIDFFCGITLIIKFSFISMFMGMIKHNSVNKLFMLVLVKSKIDLKLFSFWLKKQCFNFHTV